MLRTVNDALAVIGRTKDAARELGVGPSALSNWRADGQFPAKRYLAISKALQKRGHEIPLELFDMAQLPKRRGRPKGQPKKVEKVEA
jgi:hypothetical protein